MSDTGDVWFTSVPCPRSTGCLYLGLTDMDVLSTRVSSKQSAGDSSPTMHLYLPVVCDRRRAISHHWDSRKIVQILGPPTNQVGRLPPIIRQTFCLGRTACSNWGRNAEIQLITAKQQHAHAVDEIRKPAVKQSKANKNMCFDKWAVCRAKNRRIPGLKIQRFVILQWMTSEVQNESWRGIFLGRYRM